MAASVTALCLALPFSIAGTNIALGLVCAGLMWHALSAGRLPWRRTWGAAALCLWIYVAVCALTGALGVAPAESLRILPKELHKIGVFYALLLACVCAPEAPAAAALVLGFTAVAGYGAAQSVVKSAANGWFWIRASGFMHPVTYGDMLALALLGALCFLLRPGQNQPRQRELLVFLGIGTLAFILNQTRAAFLALFIGFLTLCAADRELRRWIKWALLAAMLGAVALELLPTHRSLLGSLRDFGATVAKPGSNPQLDRLALWDVAWRAFRDHPVLGVGPGNYRTVFPRYFSGEIATQRVWGSAHSLYLHQLAERGLLGLAALLALFAAMLARAWQRVRALPNAWNLWALGTMAAFLVMNLTEISFQNELVATFLIIIWVKAEAQT